MKVSFCTTCMGRTHHLKETYIKNIKCNLGYGDVEFILLNYSSKDGMEEWIDKELNPFLIREIGYPVLKYIVKQGEEYFNMAKAKNLAHYASTGQIVCNLDADNLTGAGFIQFIKEEFKKNMDIVLKSDWKESEDEGDMRGTSGRLALSKDNFLLLGGYDESFVENFDEINLLDRCVIQKGLTEVIIPKKYLKSILHSEEIRNDNYPHHDTSGQTLNRNSALREAKLKSLNDKAV